MADEFAVSETPQDGMNRVFRNASYLRNFGGLVCRIPVSGQKRHDSSAFVFRSPGSYDSNSSILIGILQNRV